MEGTRPAFLIAEYQPCQDAGSTSSRSERTIDADTREAYSRIGLAHIGPLSGTSAL